MASYSPSPELLKGRTVLVTGAGDGLGRTAALAYSAHGAEVILVGRTVAKLEAVYDEILKQGGREPAIYPMDLAGASAKDYRDLAENIGRQIGHLEGVLHNAAELELLTPLEFHPIAAWETALRVNLTAPFLMTQACLGLLKQATDSAVIFTSDECAHRPKGYWGGYAVSKAGVENLGLMLAQELSNTAIRVHVLDPGSCRTAMRLRTHPGAPLAGYPCPETLIPMYLYLMGPDGRQQSGVWKAQEWIRWTSDARSRTV